MSRGAWTSLCANSTAAQTWLSGCWRGSLGWRCISTRISSGYLSCTSDFDSLKILQGSELVFLSILPSFVLFVLPWGDHSYHSSKDFSEVVSKVKLLAWIGTQYFAVNHPELSSCICIRKVLSPASSKRKPKGDSSSSTLEAVVVLKELALASEEWAGKA